MEDGRMARERFGCEQRRPRSEAVACRVVRLNSIGAQHGCCLTRALPCAGGIWRAIHRLAFDARLLMQHALPSIPLAFDAVWQPCVPPIYTCPGYAHARGQHPAFLPAHNTSTRASNSAAPNHSYIYAAAAAWHRRSARRSSA